MEDHRRPTWRLSSVLALSLGLGGGLLSGCGPDPSGAGPPPAAPTAPVPPVVADPEPAAFPAFPVPAGEPRYRTVLSKRLQLSLPLPDRSGWTMPPQPPGFLVLRHAATASTLTVRVWREPENMSGQRCEQRARLHRDLPSRGQAISRRFEELPAGFDTQVDVGLLMGSPGQEVGGYVLAFGASARRCFAFAFATVATGAGAEQLVADRLVVIDGLTLAGVKLQSPIAGLDR